MTPTPWTAAERTARGELHRICRLPALKSSKGQAARLRKYVADATRELDEIRKA